ncbi:lactate utilization protein C [Mariniflexile ostreae]|uniref:Lactate utilization protein C n=1 Tax=Mariniflexile ostreae TaxID=1520892 RepID=A0ABV5F8B6_9FLAO
MGSREHILAKLTANKPEAIALPQIDISAFDNYLNIVEEFTKKVEVVGGQIIEINDDKDVLNYITKTFPDTKTNFSTLKHDTLFNTIDMEKLNKPHELEDLDVLILESNLGIAENGAIWLTDSQLPNRVLPFITKHLVIVMSKKDIVSNMHNAYSKVKDFGFGVFISGPSKTADIEQSLVIGAHGALSMSVFLKS